jgi:CRISPR-associated protein Cas1
MNDLRLLPRIRDSLSSLYIEHAHIDSHYKSIAIHDKSGYVPVPSASLSVLMIGPGTTITHSAISALAENNCLVIWCGEENVRFYSFGTGGTRNSNLLLHQAKMACNDQSRLEVARRMYAMRFEEILDEGLTLQQLRGMEGARVREAYARRSRETGIKWSGRNYDRSKWTNADPINRAISSANSCLYGICHAAVLSTGLSPGIGFIHTGKQLSFVYDIADLYKLNVTLPIAFQVACDSPEHLERAVRKKCRDTFREKRLLKTIVPDIMSVLGLTEASLTETFGPDFDPALPTHLWDPQTA